MSLTSEVEFTDVVHNNWSCRSETQLFGKTFRLGFWSALNPSTEHKHRMRQLNSEKTTRPVSATFISQVDRT
jgi:hypothetical protein